MVTFAGVMTCRTRDQADAGPLSYPLWAAHHRSGQALWRRWIARLLEKQRVWVRLPGVPLLGFYRRRASGQVEVHRSLARFS